MGHIRRLSSQRLMEAAATAFDKLVDEVYDLAEHALDRDTRDFYLAAKEAWPAQRLAIEGTLRTGLRERFDQAGVPREVPTAQFAEVKSSWDELSLVDDAVVEENMRFGEIANRIRHSSEEELEALDQRLAIILDMPEMASSDSPLAPAGLSQWLRAGLAAVDLPMKVKLLLIRGLDETVRPATIALYKEINEFLKDNGVLPTVRLGPRKGRQTAGTAAPAAPAEAVATRPLPSATAETPMAAAPPVPDAGAAGVPATVATTDTARAGLEAGIEAFQMLQQLLVATTAAAQAARVNALPRNTGSGAAGPTTGAMPAAAYGTPASGAGTLILPGGASGMMPSVPAGLQVGLIGSLTRLQQGDTAVISDAPAETSARFVSRGVVLPPGSDAPGAVNLLHDLKATNLARGMGQVDLATLDIVALLFDQIFGDARIPQAMKALIGRLQIPVLKVALLDKGFFAHRTHPARRMLDTLGELSLGLGEPFDSGAPLYRRIDGTLGQLVDQFEDDLGVFDRATAEFEAMIAELNRAADDAGRRESVRIDHKERLGVARLFAQKELRQRLEGQPLPREVLRFLSTEWMKLLILAHAKGGPESRAWHSLVETLDILMWSLVPKQTVDERRRMVSVLPGLLKRLARGMEIIGTDAHVRDRFNAVLMRCHARTVTGGHPLQGSPNATLSPTQTRSGGEGLPEPIDITSSFDARSGPSSPLEDGSSLDVTESESDPGHESNPDYTLPPHARMGEPPRSVETPVPEPLPEVFPTVKLRNPFGEGEIEVQEITIDDLPGLNTVITEAVSESEAAPDEYAARLAALTEGDWVEIHRDGQEPVQARLSLVSQYRSTFVFSNRRGQKVGEYSAYQVLSYLRSGRLLVLPGVPLFDRAFGGLVNFLRQTAPQP